ncbi:hypothetical protein OS242_16045 [Tumebacillus sp. DT12]|uniref:DUF2273 domain-containing protein n=1 Tax=Tumebacillus lacus TaxID=2995335 RepID=A0ABT3X3J2_9BACL|nr:hypothetical protein [Tumebacillus lacus]MCX7571460.1 hypothetical protein [Tumebacillus lacus]
MSMLNRYFFYTLTFIIVLVGIATKNYAIFGLTILIGVALGFMTEYFDNRRDEAFKHHNANHQYKH